MVSAGAVMTRSRFTPHVYALLRSVNAPWEALKPRKMIGRKKNGTSEFHVAGNGLVNTSITVSEVYLLFYICTWCILGFELRMHSTNHTTLLNFGKDELESQVAVEGNIGSGKTSLLKYFKQNSMVEIIEEPVKKWQNVDGFNTLDLMYSDPKRWSYLFESYALLTMMEIHHQPQTSPVRLLERTAYSARYCFVENLHQNGMMSTMEYTVFDEWFKYLMSHEKPQIDLIGGQLSFKTAIDDYVYLRTSPEKCMERIKKRSRNEETSVSMELLNSLHERYEDWLIKKSKFGVPAQVLVVDGNQSLEDMFQFYETNSQVILGISASKTD
ncbi:Thymidine kinase 2 [Acropora cervicornis]|uniref:Thymidine kinase 2 n=1 Tax=Acropora cervicornis TaxID=6130 RepID=A0AAD9USL4_ACRCE|nr:Thymidine kinase 2 [Acropora cervicornis]